MIKGICVTIFCLISANLFAQQDSSEKKIRPLSPDRPHQTESPYTVDAGHFQLEADFFNFKKENVENNRHINHCEFFSFNAKIGIHKRMDIEFLSSPYSTTKEYPGEFLQQNYLPEFTIRYKINIIGNDSGSFPVGLLAVVKTTNFFKEKLVVNGAGLLLVAEKELPGECSIGYTGGFSDISVNPFFSETELFSTVSFDYRLFSSVHHFVEVSYHYNKSAVDRHLYSIDSGVLYNVARNMQLDAGMYYYLPQKSPFVFIGGTIKI